MVQDLGTSGFLSNFKGQSFSHGNVSLGQIYLLLILYLNV